jgi:hypothetical protein
MKHIFIFSLINILFISCLPKPENKTLTYQNLIIISDLSDRIEPTINGNIPNQQYPPKDIKEIENILEYFKEECVKPGEKIGDKSSLTFSTFSYESIASIDIEAYDGFEKEQFINSTGNFKNKGLNFEIENFKQKVKNSYSTIRNEGLDLISSIIDKIEHKNLIKNNTISTNGIDSTFIEYDNHIYIFTDGYLEYRNKEVNSQFYFGEKEIEKIRTYCKLKNLDINSALNINKDFNLPPIINEKNKLIHLHIYETHERDKDQKRQTYKNPINLRDNDILQAVWRKWALESGFKSFEWKKY